MRWNFCLETLSSVAQLHSPSILNESNQTNYSDGMRLCVCVSCAKCFTFTWIPCTC